MHKVYRRRRKPPERALDGLELVVGAGGVHGFLGPNGSGKTTTIRMLLGLVAADEGSLRLFGRPVPKALPQVVGALVETPLFFPTFSARLNLGGRSVLLAVCTALLGMAVAHLIRSAGAALGAAFVYFVIVETAVGAFRPGWQEWLLTTNAVALVTTGGVTISVPGKTVDSGSGQIVEYTQQNISNLHGGLVLGSVALALLTIGAWLFRRRDLT